jgi:hypothetical protein
MSSVNQGAWVPGTSRYEYGYRSIPNIPITGAPADANFSRWAMLHDGGAYRLYCFKGSSTDTLYQFAWDGASYAYGYNSIPVLTLVGAPSDADASSIAMLHSGNAYHAYLRRLGDPFTLYQFIWVPGTTTYQWGYQNYLPDLQVTGFPSDTDWSRWDMLHDGSAYRLSAFHYGSNDRLSQGRGTQTPSNTNTDTTRSHSSNSSASPPTATSAARQCCTTASTTASTFRPSDHPAGLARPPITRARSAGYEPLTSRGERPECPHRMSVRCRIELAP